jgi:hypothetical protein
MLRVDETDRPWKKIADIRLSFNNLRVPPHRGANTRVSRVGTSADDSHPPKCATPYFSSPPVPARSGRRVPVTKYQNKFHPIPTTTYNQNTPHPESPPRKLKDVKAK